MRERLVKWLFRRFVGGRNVSMIHLHARVAWDEGFLLEEELWHRAHPAPDDAWVRVPGREDVVVRFSDDEVAGQGSVPDLGPFTVVVIGTYDVRGDDETLAVRVSRIAPWQLTDRAGARFQGAMKDALIFVAAGRSTASQPRPIGTTAEPRASQPTIAAATSGAGAAKEAAEDDAPSVWIDRVRAAPEIYISRPERKR